MVSTTSVTTKTELNNSENEGNQNITEISCRPPDDKNDKSVTWDPETVDNEHLNKKSSKSCCIFTGKKRCKHKANIEDCSDTDSSTSDIDTD